MLLIFPSASADRKSLVRAAKKFGARQVLLEGPVLVCKVTDPQIALRLGGIKGIDGVTVARQTSKEFSGVIGAIIEEGSKAIMCNEKFYVKAILTAKADFVERDIEFASAGALVEKLSKVHALPARHEHEADRVILAVIGKRVAYVCVTDKTGLSL